MRGLRAQRHLDHVAGPPSEGARSASNGGPLIHLFPHDARGLFAATDLPAGRLAAQPLSKSLPIKIETRERILDVLPVYCPLCSMIVTQDVFVEPRGGSHVGFC